MAMPRSYRAFLARKPTLVPIEKTFGRLSRRGFKGRFPPGALCAAEQRCSPTDRRLLRWIRKRGLFATYAEMAAHYGVAVLPARVRAPKDKAKAEAGVLLVERWILARLQPDVLLPHRAQRGDRRDPPVPERPPVPEAAGIPPLPLRGVGQTGVEAASGRSRRTHRFLSCPGGGGDSLNQSDELNRRRLRHSTRRQGDARPVQELLSG
jgi:hypothetical protein